MEAQDQISQSDIENLFDTHSEDYDATTNDSLGFSGLNVDFFVRAKAHHIELEARRVFGKTTDLSVLDVGCGIGKYHKLLSDTFGRLSGVDVSQNSLSVAQSNNPDVDYRHYSGERLPYPDNSFDMAYTICVMHHVPPQYWENFASEMMRVLRPGGQALIFEHNPLNPLTRKAVNDCPYDEDAVLLRPAKVQSLFRKTGAHDIRREHILTIPAISGLLKTVDRFFSFLPFGAQYCVSIRKDQSAADVTVG